MSRRWGAQIAQTATRRGAGQLIRTAIVRPVPSTFAGGEVREAAADPVDVVRAQRQHGDYVQALRRFVHHVVELPTMDAHPDCCFVEDVALTNLAPGRALVTNVGVASRRGEEGPVADALRELLGPDAVVDMRDAAAKSDDDDDDNNDDGGEPPALDGGDVLFTGRDIFVGLSERTNAAGAAFLRDRGGLPPALRERVHAIPVVGNLHLKSVVTHLDDETLVVADTEGGLGMYAAMNIAAQGAGDGRGYAAVTVEEGAANVMPVNGGVFVAGQYPRSVAELARACEERGLEAVALDNGEFEKMDGAHTCKSLLIPGTRWTDAADARLQELSQQSGDAGDKARELMALLEEEAALVENPSSIGRTFQPSHVVDPVPNDPTSREALLGEWVRAQNPDFAERCHAKVKDAPAEGAPVFIVDGANVVYDGLSAPSKLGPDGVMTLVEMVRELKAGSPEDEAYVAVVMSAPTTAHVKNVCEAGYRELVDSAAAFVEATGAQDDDHWSLALFFDWSLRDGHDVRIVTNDQFHRDSVHTKRYGGQLLARAHQCSVMHGGGTLRGRWTW